MKKKETEKLKKPPELDRDVLFNMVQKGLDEGQKELDEMPIRFPGIREGDGIREVLDEP